MLHREFPRQASVWPEGTSRRDFLKLMSASMALAGLSACVKQPLEPIVPYVRQPNEIVLGKPLFFASAMPFGAYATPVLVESHEGRPTKIEGNPEHPAGLGGSDVFAQASILDMYDPDRSQIITYLGNLSTWSDYNPRAEGALNSQKALKGSGLRILSRTISSPTMASLMDQVQAAYPRVEVGAVGAGESRQRARRIARWRSAQYVETRYNLEKADIILSLDGDFLSSGFPGFLYYARQLRGAAQSRPERKDVALLLHSEHADQYQRQGRSSSAGAGFGSRAAGARDCGGAGRWRRTRRQRSRSIRSSLRRW